MTYEETSLRIARWGVALRCPAPFRLEYDEASDEVRVLAKRGAHLRIHVIPEKVPIFRAIAGDTVLEEEQGRRIVLRQIEHRIGISSTRPGLRRHRTSPATEIDAHFNLGDGRHVECRGWVNGHVDASDETMAAFIETCRSVRLDG
jgi:hypothetical protein